MKFTVGVDVDGTLIHQVGPLCDTPRYEVIQLLHLLKLLNPACEIYCWSGSGVDYAARWCEKLGMHKVVTAVIGKGSMTVDLAIDDFPVDDLENEKIKQTLGKVLFRV